MDRTIEGMHVKDQLFGRIALHWKFIQPEHWQEATQLLAQSPGVSAGEILMRLGHIDGGKLRQLLDGVAKTQAQTPTVGASSGAGTGASSGPSSMAQVSSTRVQDNRSTSAASNPLGSMSKTAVNSDPLTVPGVKTSVPPQRNAVSEPLAVPHEGSATATVSNPNPADSPQVSAAASSRTVTEPNSALRDLHAVLREAVRRGASDLQLHAGFSPMYRMDGQLTSDDSAPLNAETVEAMVLASLSTSGRELFEKAGEVDLSYSVESTDTHPAARFRGNVFRHRRGVDAAYRVVPEHIPSFAELNMPESLSDFAHLHQGLVLFTGPGGCGKSTTMASMLDLINTQRAEHILTVEDPIEFVHQPKQCQINQREVGSHTASFARALKGALREDPDIIAIGELRDLETISLALTAAETGHLVFATMHTNSAISTLNRLVGVFPPGQQGQIRSMVGESLKAVIVQKLALRKDGEGRVPVLEILRLNPAVANLVREEKTSQIENVLQTGASHGMCNIDSSLKHLLRDGAIEREEALRLCVDRRRFAAGGN